MGIRPQRRNVPTTRCLRRTLKDWRVAGILKKGIYWTTFPHIPSRHFWNKDLVRDWFVNGNSASHTRAVERYLASLPSSSVYNPAA